MSHHKAPNNRTMQLTDSERSHFNNFITSLETQIRKKKIENTIFCHDIHTGLHKLPSGFVDLLFLDPPYNLTKSFNGRVFKELDGVAYTAWMESWFQPMMRLLKPTASVYICGDWHSSLNIVQVAQQHLIIRNRITWEREKGRGALKNWKNCSEDVWFCTVSNSFTFNAEKVRLRRRVIAPYKEDGQPKDWKQTTSGKFRDTAASNLWTDLTVPFWSMPENTSHPTQKPEKLLAKLILASTNPGDIVFDPFFGSGTALVAAKKLGRRFVGIEQDHEYCLLAAKRLHLADTSPTIQGFEDGVFWERNTKYRDINR